MNIYPYAMIKDSQGEFIFNSLNMNVCQIMLKILALGKNLNLAQKSVAQRGQY